MNADRTVLTDGMRARIKDTLPGKATDPGATAADSRLFVEAVLWRFRTGSPWRGIPERSGRNDSVSRRFRRRVLSGVSGRVSDTLSGESGPGRVSGGGAVVQARRKAAGSKGGGRAQGIGCPGGGLTTGAVAVVDALGYPVRFAILPGQAHDPRGCRISPAASRSGPSSATGRPAPTGCWRIWRGAARRR